MSPDPKILSQQIQQQKQKLRKAADLDSSFIKLSISLPQAVRCDAQHMVRYKDELVTVLKYTLHAKCKDTSDLSGTLLRHLLRGLTLTYALDYRSTVNDWDQPLADHLPIRVS